MASVGWRHDTGSYTFSGTEYIKTISIPSASETLSDGRSYLWICMCEYDTSTGQPDVNSFVGTQYFANNFPNTRTIDSEWYNTDGGLVAKSKYTFETIWVSGGNYRYFSKVSTGSAEIYEAITSTTGDIRHCFCIILTPLSTNNLFEVINNQNTRIYFDYFAVNNPAYVDYEYYVKFYPHYPDGTLGTPFVGTVTYTTRPPAPSTYPQSVQFSQDYSNPNTLGFRASGYKGIGWNTQQSGTTVQYGSEIPAPFTIPRNTIPYGAQGLGLYGIWAEKPLNMKVNINGVFKDVATVYVAVPDGQGGIQWKEATNVYVYANNTWNESG